MFVIRNFVQQALINGHITVSTHNFNTFPAYDVMDYAIIVQVPGHLQGVFVRRLRRSGRQTEKDYLDNVV